MCQAQGKKSLKSGLQKNFAKMCRRPKAQNLSSNEGPNKRNKNLETEESTPSEDDKVNDFHENFNTEYDSNYSLSDINVVANSSVSNKIELVYQKETIGTIETMILVDSDTLFTIIKESLARCEDVTNSTFEFAAQMHDDDKAF